MSTRFRVVLAAAAVVAGLTLSSAAQPPAGTPPQGTPPPGAPPEGAPPPAPRHVPGINAPDAFASGCVSCHVNMPHENMDNRLSTAMARWTEKVDPKLLAKAQAAMPAGTTLKGKHPPAAKALENIPAGCLACHGKSSKTAPPFARMIHVIHLTGGEENHYISMFQAECTHCHKMDRANGQWSLVSAAEK